MPKKRASKRGKKIDPIASYRRNVQKRARGMKDRERLDLYIHLMEEDARPDKNESTARFSYLQERIAILLKRLGHVWDPYLTLDKKYQAKFDPNFMLRTARDRARFKRFIRQIRGEQVAKKAIIEQINYVPNPDVLDDLSPAERREFCRLYNMKRCKVGSATDKAREGK